MSLARDRISQFLAPFHGASVVSVGEREKTLLDATAWRGREHAMLSTRASLKEYVASGHRIIASTNPFTAAARALRSREF